MSEGKRQRKRERKKGAGEYVMDDLESPGLTTPPSLDEPQTKLIRVENLS